MRESSAVEVRHTRALLSIPTTMLQRGGQGWIATQILQRLLYGLDPDALTVFIRRSRVCIAVQGAELIAAHEETSLHRAEAI